MSEKHFASIREALEYAVGRIAAEAEREGVPLSEVECKMLYFTETSWTLPGIMEVNKEFDRLYDQNEYEAKIAGLIRNFVQRALAENEEEFSAWTNAIDKIGEEDFYLLVMVGAATRSERRRWRWLPILSDFDLYRPVGREPGDRLRFWIAALVVVFVCLGAALLYASFTGPH